MLVPVEMMSNVVKVRRSRSTTPHHQNRLSVESVATQTSDRSDEEESSHLETKNSEDWLTGFDEKDGERIDVDEEYDEQESERFMRRRREFDEKHGSKKLHPPPPPPPPPPEEVASDEVRVSIESDMSPPKDSDPPTSSGSPGISENDANPLAGPGVPDPKKSSPAKKSSGSSQDKGSAPGGAKRSPDKKNPGTGSTDPKAPGSGTSGSAPPPTGSGSEDAKASKDPKNSKAAANGDKSYVASQYFGQPGENLSALSSNPPLSAAPKSSSPAARPSIFPYFVDPKAPSPSVSTSKASSKLTDPEQENDDSSCALYRNKKKKMATDSKKVYTGTPKAKTPQ